MIQATITQKAQNSNGVIGNLLDHNVGLSPDQEPHPITNLSMKSTKLHLD